MSNNSAIQFNCDLTEVIKGGECCLISDPEGYKFSKLAGPKYTVHGDRVRQDKPLIVLGDMIDSTATVNIFNSLDGKLKSEKSFNLANLLEAKQNKSIHVLFGNRDLNKLKVLPLTMIAGNQSWFKDGKTYLDIATNLNDNINKESYKWLIPDLSAWYPFWSNFLNVDANKALWTLGRKSSPDTQMTCYERFALIFGVDTTVGTMSAPNLLYCIPREILGEEKFNTTFPEFAKNIKSSPPLNLNILFDYMPGGSNYNKSLFDDLNLAAALVLTVFHRLLIKPVDLSNAQVLKYDYLLYKLYKSSRSYFCAHANTTFGGKKYLSLFSHGGMTTHFTAEKLNEFTSLLGDGMFTASLRKMTGGFYKEGVVSTESSSLIKFCQEFNTMFKGMLCEIIDLDYKVVNGQSEPINNMLAMILLTSPTDCSKHKTETKFNTKLFSPILPGIDDYRKNPISCSDKGLIQFIGHAPNGFGVTVDLYTNAEGEDSYLVNLDISNTIFSNAIMDVAHINDLFINVELDSNSVYINGDIYTTSNKKARYFYHKFDILTPAFKKHLMKYERKVTADNKELHNYEHGIISKHGKLNYLRTLKKDGGFAYDPELELVNSNNIAGGPKLQGGGSRKRRSSSKLSKYKSKKRVPKRR